MVSSIALSSGSLYTYGLARVFALAAEAGFDAVELMVDNHWDNRQPTYVQRISQETGLRVVAVHSPFVPWVSGWPHDPLGRLRESAALARAVGTDLVVTHLPLRIRVAKVEFLGFRTAPRLFPIFLPNEGDYRRFLLNGLARFEAAEGVRIGVENMPVKKWLGRRIDIHALNNLEKLGTLPHLTMDTTHFGTWGVDLLAVYEQLKERIIHVHLSNFDGREHRLPEDGHLPLGRLLQKLAQDGYQGAVSLEFGPEVLHAENDVQVLEHLRRSLDFCREHAAPPNQ
jgi:sugar phosphate isomerase/epimerase